MLEEQIKLYWFASISPEQFFTEAGCHREAVVAADENMVIRCFGDDFAGFVHDDFHVPASNRTRRSAPPQWCVV
jgi:hypothetical protein